MSSFSCKGAATMVNIEPNRLIALANHIRRKSAPVRKGVTSTRTAATTRRN